MSASGFGQQEYKKKVSLFKRTLTLQDNAMSVWIQRIPTAQLARYLSDSADPADPVVAALRKVNTTFKECKDKTVDMLSSIEAVAAEHKNTSKGDGAVLLAWHMSFDTAGKAMRDPVLVGVLTLFNFVKTPEFSTTSEYIGARDMNKLNPYFGSKWTYIDGLCSKRSGVGRLLVLHAYAFALSRGKTGVIALSYSPRKNSPAESLRTFKELGFFPLIENADFKIHMYGTWFVMTTASVNLKGLTKTAFNVCARKAYTNDSLVWRCPG